jgi:hypothetical protein
MTITRAVIGPGCALRPVEGRGRTVDHDHDHGIGTELADP